MKFAFAFASLASAADLKLATFDGAQETTASWKCQNDPVMGGASASTFDETTGVFEGNCAIVGFLKAPGFAKIVGSKSFADITNFDSFSLKVKSSTPAYAGFKLAFAAPNVPKTSIFGGGSYKAGFTLKDTQDWQIVDVPFTQFSYDWSGYTGRCDTQDPGSFGRDGQQHYCCDKSGIEPSKPEVCVDAQFLSSVNDLEVWAEGVEGDFNIQLEYIGVSSTSELKASADEIVLESFDEAVHTWSSQNDPVMGGKSTSTFTIADGVGTLDGTCAIVPSLNAPGFITARTTDSTKFPDISNCQGLALTTRSESTPANYEGYRISFGSDSAFLSCGKFFARGFKADFTAGEGEFSTVQIPFDMFTKCWDDATGDAVKACKDFPQFCPTSTRLKDLQTISIWAEGKEADVKLDVKKIAAYGCSTLV